MEIFVDLGFFEVIAVFGLAALSRAIYSNRVLRVPFLIATAIAPAAMWLSTSVMTQRGIVLVCLVMSRFVEMTEVL